MSSDFDGVELSPLAACPFCGSAASVGADVWGEWAVGCTAPLCAVDGPGRPTMGAAVDAWNSRPTALAVETHDDD